jgi:hypothetical protein
VFDYLHGRGNVHGHDYSYGSVWQSADEKYVCKLLRQRNPELMEKRISKIWDDHRAIYDKKYARMFEPVSVTYKEDLVVNEGLTRLAQLATGQSSTSFTHFVSGTGSTAEGAGRTIADVVESARVSMSTSGDRYATGTSMKFAGFFPSTSPTATITQGAAADNATPSAGTILFYTKYGSGLSHTAGTTFYVLQQTITQTAS